MLLTSASPAAERGLDSRPPPNAHADDLILTSPVCLPACWFKYYHHPTSTTSLAIRRLSLALTVLSFSSELHHTSDRGETSTNMPPFINNPLPASMRSECRPVAFLDRQACLAWKGSDQLVVYVATLSSRLFEDNRYSRGIRISVAMSRSFGYIPPSVRNNPRSAEVTYATGSTLSLSRSSKICKKIDNFG